MKSLTFEVPRPLSSAPIISVISLTPWSLESISPEKLGPRPKDVESEPEDRASPTSNLPVPSSSLCLFPSSDPMRLSTLPPPLFFCSRRTLRSNASASSSTTMASSPSIARNLLPAVGGEREALLARASDHPGFFEDASQVKSSQVKSSQVTRDALFTAKLVSAKRLHPRHALNKTSKANFHILLTEVKGVDS